MNKLFLYSLLQSSLLSSELSESIQSIFGIEPSEFEWTLDKAEDLVFYKNKRQTNQNLESVLRHIAVSDDKKSIAFFRTSFDD